MKKRVLSLFMALMLCLTLLPTAALAEETNVAEVTIDGTTYTAPTVKFRVDSGTTYDVIVYADLASMEYLGTYAQTNGKPWNLPQPPARSGKTFAGWKVAGGDLIGANDVVALDGDATVFGVWENAQTSTPARI